VILIRFTELFFFAFSKVCSSVPTVDVKNSNIAILMFFLLSIYDDDSFKIPFSCTIFSDVVVEADGNRLSRSLPDDFSSRLSIYFQNVNRLRTKTSDLFKAVLENDYWKRAW
jgi:hypothetical protein